jgi:GntR family transcriptional regulator
MYPPGEKLPSERVLAEQYGSARNTAREAIRLLAESGLVTAEHGRGVFVREPAPLLRTASDRYASKWRDSGTSPWRAECERQGKVPRTDVLSVERIVPPIDVADRLGLPTASKSVVRRHNVMFADDEPMQIVLTFIPWETAKGTGLTKARVGNPRGIYAVLEEQGHTMTRHREAVSARMPTPEERATLDMPIGVPVLHVVHTSYDQHDQPYEVTHWIMRADRTGLAYDTPVD